MIMGTLQNARQNGSSVLMDADSKVFNRLVNPGLWRIIVAARD
jgi:hypothetical protein